MKNIKLYGFIFIAAVLAMGFVSCKNVISLGEKLILEGPDVQINTPLARQPVDGIFNMSGKITMPGRSELELVLVKCQYKEETAPGSGIFEDKVYKIQWRYGPNKYWEISGDTGSTWKKLKADTLTDGTEVEVNWEENGREISWQIPINMKLYSLDPGDGQYQFSVTAWDTAGNSDDNSYKTRTVVLSNEPPKVEIVLPSLYPSIALNDPESELCQLMALTDHRVPAYIGKLLNGPLDLRFQINSTNDVWSVDVRFYENGVNWEVDEDDYVYRTYINDALSRPPVPDPADTLRPNYRITVPDMSKAAYAEQTADTDTPQRFQEQKKKIEDLTALRVVVRCLDSAGHELQQREQGLFIYWPEADIPWITFPEGLKDDYNDTLYTIYPNSKVPARAYDDDGIRRLSYKIYTVIDTSGNYSPIPLFDETLENRTGSRIFSWQFEPPFFSGDYYIIATAEDINQGANRQTCIAKGYFKVMDVNFPEIFPPDNPIASQPMYRFIDGPTIDDWTIEVKGKATAMMEVDNVSMVWINPNSINYAAMSQLAYFRDPEYEGWDKAPANPASPPGEDSIYDTSGQHPNLVWKMELSEPTDNPSTGRQEYTYRKVISLKDQLNIRPGDSAYNYLKSQVFVLKVTDKDLPKGKSSIIIWAPQGDTQAPEVKISKVDITRYPNYPALTNPSTETWIPGVYVNESGQFLERIKQFHVGDKISLSGTWSEDSAGSKDSQKPKNKSLVFDPFFKVTLNNRPLAAATTYTDAVEGKGTWTASATIDDTTGAVFVPGAFMETLVVNALFTDIGGNIYEHGASWLMENEELKFSRVGSLSSDRSYNETDTSNTDPLDPGYGYIDVFLEFNKPVKLMNTTTPPVLLLNSTNGGPAAVAIYNADHEDHHKDPSGASTRQHFTYQVMDKHYSDRLNLSGIQGGDTGFGTGTYASTWETVAGDEFIQMVITRRNGNFMLNGKPLYQGVLPTSEVSSADNYNLTLKAGKYIKIDTIPPVLRSISSTTDPGYYKTGNVLYVDLDFDEPVKFGTGANTPKLELNIENSGLGYTSVLTETVKKNDNILTFSYTIKAGDKTTGFGDLQVKGYAPSPLGDFAITDLVDNPFTSFTGSNTLPKTMAGIHVDTIKPDAPTIELLTGESAATADRVVNALGVQGYSDTSTPAASWPPAAGLIKALQTLYYKEGQLFWKISSIDPSTTGKTGKAYDYIEFSINNGRSWTRWNYTTIQPVPGSSTYQVSARQIDRAGNVSDWTNPVTFTWDQGGLLTRISSSAASGIYKKDAVIPIVLYFRKEVTITQASFLLNVIDTTVSQPVPPDPPVYIPALVFNSGNASAWSSSPDKRTWTFNYTVGDNHSTENLDLRIRDMTITATDAYGTNVSTLINMEDAENNNVSLHQLRSIKVRTGKPILDNIRFFQNPGEGEQSDGTYWTNMELTFTVPVFRGAATLAGGVANEITLEQNIAGFRMPVVLTENQFARYNSKWSDPSFPVAGALTIFNDYFSKATNGYLATETRDGQGVVTNASLQGPDISPKYVMKVFDNTGSPIDTYNITPNAAGTNLQKLAYAFWYAEKVTLSAYSTAVSAPGTTKVTVKFADANAMKVLGADYTLVYKEGFMEDELGNLCQGLTKSDVTVDGVARPVIRIHKPQETISTSVATPSGTQPQLVATQPENAYVFMDCRTPGSTVNYRVSTNHNSNIWRNPTNPGSAAMPSSTSAWGYGIGSGNRYDIVDRSSADPTYPGNPRTGTAFSSGGAVNPRIIGTAAETGGVYNGNKYWINAAGQKGSTYSTNNAYEVANRTVFVFTGTNVGAVGGQTFSTGDQLWIRGGNTINSTSIPGFPLTPADNWVLLGAEKDRAGIKLMSKTSGSSGSTLTNSVWQWVTWEINSTTYFDLLLGRMNLLIGVPESNGSINLNEVYQYGPRYFAAHTGNWTTMRELYRAYPGERRWLNNANPDLVGSGASQAGPYTFNASTGNRSLSLTATITQPPAITLPSPVNL